MLEADEIHRNCQEIGQRLSREELIKRWTGAEILLEYARQERDSWHERFKVAQAAAWEREEDLTSSVAAGSLRTTK